MALSSSKNIDVHVALEPEGSHYVDVSALIERKEGSWGPAAFRPTVSESPAKFMALGTEPIGRPTKDVVSGGDLLQGKSKDKQLVAAPSIGHKGTPMSPETILGLAKQYPVDELAVRFHVIPGSVSTRINRSVNKVAKAQGRPAAEVKAELDQARLRNGLISELSAQHSLSRHNRLANGKPIRPRKDARQG